MAIMVMMVVMMVVVMMVVVTSVVMLLVIRVSPTRQVAQSSHQYSNWHYYPCVNSCVYQ